LQDAEKGLERLLDTYARLQKLTSTNDTASHNLATEIKGLRDRCEAAMCDDLNTPVVISYLFDAGRIVNTVADGKSSFSVDDLDELKAVFKCFIEDILGLKTSANSSDNRNEAFRKAIDLLLAIRQQAKADKDWSTSDRVRNELTSFGFKIKDTKDGVEWNL
jgi:cysteinyl-tRNA synthetase